MHTLQNKSFNIVRGCVKNNVSQRFIEGVSSSSSGRLGGGGGRKVLVFTFYCLDFPSSSSSLFLHCIVGLIAGGLETVRDSVLRCHR